MELESMMDSIKQQESEEEKYVSPTSDETPQERYARVTREEAHMTETEIDEKIKRLDARSELFDWEGNE
jgi:hypothetical protein